MTKKELIKRNLERVYRIASDMTLFLHEQKKDSNAQVIEKSLPSLERIDQLLGMIEESKACIEQVKRIQEKNYKF